jgi:hypothetical protein
VQVIFAGMPQGDELKDKFQYLYETGSSLEGGGVLSSIVALPLMKFFGIIGARIIVCLLLFITLMLLTNLTLFQLFDYMVRPFRNKLFGMLTDGTPVITEYALSESRYRTVLIDEYHIDTFYNTTFVSTNETKRVSYFYKTLHPSRR